MKIVDILKPGCVIAELKAVTKEEVLGELSKVLARTVEGVDEEEMTRVLIEREKLGSTGIGDGVAIPHGKMRQVNKVIASFGRSSQGIDFESIDGKPAHIFFLLIAPEDSAGIHLKALARISRLSRDPVFRTSLLNAKDQDDVYKIIREMDEKI